MKNIFVSYCILKMLPVYLPALGLHCRTQLSLAAANGGCSPLPCAGFSLCWLLWLQSADSDTWALGSAARRLAHCSGWL